MDENSAVPDPNTNIASEPLAAATQDIWNRYRGQVIERLDAVERAALSLLEGRQTAEQRRQGERESHRLAGSVGTFGFDRASELAREAEQILMGEDEIPAAQIARLSEVVVALRLEFESSSKTQPSGMADPAPDSPGPASDEGGPRVVSRYWLISDDPNRVEDLTLEAAGRGHLLDQFGTITEAVDAYGSGPAPAAVLIDFSSSPPGEQVWAEIVEIAGTDAKIPTVIFSQPRRFTDRVEAARAGIKTFLTLPQRPASLIGALEEVTAQSTLAGTTVLAVDDDPVLLDLVSSAVGAVGARVATLQDPRDFWRSLEKAQPELVVLDFDIPGISGIDLCRTIRTDPRWRGLPVLFLTSSQDARTLTRLLEAGGDDYLPKPFDPVELVDRLAARLTRTRMLQAYAGLDPLTDVLTRERFVDAADRLLGSSRRSSEPFTVALVGIDDLQEINTVRGAAVGDEVVRRMARRLETALAPGDVIGRWGGSSFALTMHDQAKDSVAGQISQVIGGIERRHVALTDGTTVAVALRAGVAGFPDDGNEFRSIARAAESALTSARSSREKPLVVVSGGHHPDAPRARQVDILLVEDDPVLAALLRESLIRGGYSEHWIRNGQEAVTLLASDPPAVKARVVLLDVDLPGLDGYAVLQSLRETGVLDRTQVIMLTVRSAEDEVVRALQAGAADHVAKPFSLPVLMARLRRALSSRP